MEEALAAGCDQIVIVTGRGKSAIEDHFDVSYELECMLEKRGKTDLLALSRQVSHMVRLSYVRQKEAMGLGHAVLMARDLVGDEPFAVILPDDVIDAPTPCLKQMMDVFEQVQSSIVATQVIEGAAISAYGVLDGKPVEGNPRLFDVSGLVEKPKPADAPSKRSYMLLAKRTPEASKNLPFSQAQPTPQIPRPASQKPSPQQRHPEIHPTRRSAGSSSPAVVAKLSSGRRLVRGGPPLRAVSSMP